MALGSEKSIDNGENGSDYKAKATTLEQGIEPANTFQHDMTEEEEKRMVRKMDIHIFPIVIILYILSFLDRVNIGESHSSPSEIENFTDISPFSRQRSSLRP